jgi:hypothetical protein
MISSRWGRFALWILGVALASRPAASTAQAVGDSQLSGYVYIDRNNDGMLAFSDQAHPELVLPDVEIRLFRFPDTVMHIDTANTNSFGQYTFTGLPAGTYGLLQIQPMEFVDGRDTVGVIRSLMGEVAPPGSVVGSAAGANSFIDIVLPAGARGDLYNFGERGLAPAFVSKRFLLGTAPPPVFATRGDLNEDGMVDAADLAQWQNDFGVNGDSDADLDGDSDGADFLIWQRSLEATASAPSPAMAPEPAGGLLVAVALAALGGARRWTMRLAR